MILTIKTARVFRPLLEPARYKGAYGGRGSGKSHFFGELLVEECQATRGTLAVCIREVQRTLDQSAKRLVETKIGTLGLGSEFRIFNDRVQTPGDGLIIFHGMQAHNAESIKSLEGYRIAWVEEGQVLSARSLALLRPTIRTGGSQIWVSWNPRRKSDAVDELLRHDKPDNAIVVRANWSDNPWFPAVLEEERQLDLKLYPDRYHHIWEGEYARAFEGSYFSRQLADARAEGRIGVVAADPLLPIRAYWDLGGSGATADAMAVWIVQFAGQQILVLDYLEGVGQVLAYYVNELRARGWENAICTLPHDGINENNITGKRYVDHLREAGFQCEDPVKNQGKGAAGLRIEAVRRIFPKVWFNAAATEAGRDALGYYHEHRDDQRNVGLGPDHDWSSHCFTGDTEILTRYGACQIMDLPEIGEVLTPCGWKPYRSPRVTRINAPLVEVVFADGLTAKCTPDHLFMTDSGWKSAASLLPNTPIQSSLTRSHSTLTAVCTGFGRATAISAGAARNYIVMRGQQLLGQFKMAVISTIATMIRLIMPWSILSAWTARPTFHTHGATALGPSSRPGSILAKPRARKLLSGTDQKPAGFGTVETPNAQKTGLGGSVSRAVVQSVMPSLMRSFARAVTHRFIAARRARLPHIASGPKCGPRIIESVKRLNRTADVWCLTVPGEGCFSLANGAVVHNCADAFGLMAICYEEPSRHNAFSRRIEYPKHHVSRAVI